MENSLERFAPNNVNAALTDELIKRFPPSLIADALAGMLKATIQKGGHPYPDTKTRAEAIKLILAYMVGLPVQRQEVIQYRVDAVQSLLERAGGSPELTAALEQALAAQKRLLAENPETLASSAENGVQ
jgi:hypothetical protein